MYFSVYLLRTLVRTTWPLGRTICRSMDPASMSAGVSSVTAIGGDILSKIGKESVNVINEKENGLGKVIEGFMWQFRETH